MLASKAANVQFRLYTSAGACYGEKNLIDWLVSQSVMTNSKKVNRSGGEAQHVFPRYSGDWSVRKTGAERPSRSFDTQKEAVAYARTRAKKFASEVFVHRSDGRIASRASYAPDSVIRKK